MSKIMQPYLMMSFYLRLPIMLNTETDPVVLFTSHIIAPKNSEIASAGLPSLIALFLLQLSQCLTALCGWPPWAADRPDEATVLARLAMDTLLQSSDEG